MTDRQGDLTRVATEPRDWIGSGLRWVALAVIWTLLGSRFWGAELVVPRTMVSEDSPFGSGTFVNKGWRLQLVYGSSEFPQSSDALLITELCWRPDAFYGKPFKTSVAQIQINLSTTGRRPEFLSPSFSENIGKDDVEVFNGILELSSAYEGPVNGPMKFDIRVPLTTPFLYVPANGNLLLDIRNFSGSPASLVAGQGARKDGASRVSGKLNARHGAADIGADVIQFVYTLTNSPPRPPPPLVGFNVIVPEEVARIDTVFGGGTLSNPSHRSQQIYSASQFGSITGAFFISELRFRPDHFHGFPFATIVSNLQINLSTSRRTPESLSQTFAENMGMDDTVVFSGSAAVTSAFIGPAGGPKDFDIIIPLTRGFTYDPGAGDLLVEIRNFSGSSASPLSGQAVSGDGGARILGNVQGRNGVYDSGVDALQLVGWPTNVPPAIASSAERLRLNRQAWADLEQPLNGELPEPDRSASRITSVAVPRNGAAAKPKVFDLGRDFSTNSNPNGPWRMGWKKTVVGSLTLLPFAKWHESAGVPTFSWGAGGRDRPAVGRASHSVESKVNANRAGLTLPSICLTPGTRGSLETLAAVRFTVLPGDAGYYRIEVNATETCEEPRRGDPDFHVILNRTELFTQTLRPNESTAFSKVVSLREGETLDFVAGYGLDENPTVSAVKVSAILTRYADETDATVVSDR